SLAPLVGDLLNRTPAEYGLRLGRDRVAARVCDAVTPGHVGVGARVPDDHRAGTVLPFVDIALEVGVAQRMILDFGALWASGTALPPDLLQSHLPRATRTPVVGTVDSMAT